MLSTLLWAAETQSANPIVSLLPILLIGVVMYFLLIRPQRKRMRDAQELVSKTSEGDEIITNGGIYGFVNAIDGDTVWLEIADNVEIRIHRSSIARRIDPAKEPAGGEPAPATEADGDDDSPSKK